MDERVDVWTNRDVGQNERHATAKFGAAGLIDASGSQVIAGWLYSLMPKSVLGSAKNERTQAHPQRPIDRNLHAGLRSPRYRLSTQWCPSNYSVPLTGSSRRHKMTRAQERGSALRR